MTTTFLKEQITLPAVLGVTEDAEQHRNDLIVAAQDIKTITDPVGNNTAREAVVAMRQWVKDVKAMGLNIRRPIDAVTAQVKKLEDDHLKPLLDEIGRVERLATVYAVAEDRRVADEEKARLELASEAKTDADFAIISNEPMPEANRARGQTLRQKLCYEVLDIKAVYAARPELCKLEISPAAVQAVCVPEAPVNGLRLWWEQKSTYSTR